MNTPETPIETSIQTLQQYMAPSQNANLAEILVVGEKWKEEGEMLKQEWWESQSGDEFRKRRVHYSHLVEQRENEYSKELKSIGYYTRTIQARSKFIQEFAMTMIIYNKKYKIHHDPREMTSVEQTLKYIEFSGTTPIVISLGHNKLTDDLVNDLTNALITSGGLSVGTQLDLSWNSFTSEGAKSIANMIQKTGGLKEGSLLSIDGNSCDEEGVVIIIDAIAKTGGLRTGTTLDVGLVGMDIEGAKAFSKMIAQTGGLREGVFVNIQISDIGDEGVVAIAEVLEATGGLRVGVTLSLRDCEIGDKGLTELMRAIIKTGGMPVGARLNLQLNKYSLQGIEYVVNEIEKSGLLGAGSVIQLSNSEAMGSTLYARKIELNAKLPGKISISKPFNS